MKFFYNQNNGVVAVVREDHVKLMSEAYKTKDVAQALDAEADAVRAGARVFTFCHRDRFQEDPTARCFFTGSHEDLNALIEAGGHELLQCGDHPIGWSGYVPFSNQEFLRKPHLQGTGLNERAVRYVCTLADVFAAFGKPVSLKA